MQWPPRVKVRRKRAALKARSVACASSAVMSNVISREVGRAEATKGAVAASTTSVPSYACHYCQRTDGLPTRDHKIPRMYGGKGLVGNIVLCCQMCNMIKSARPYQLFVLLFGEFLETHRDEYRAANPDDFATVVAMTRKFNAWLHALQHSGSAETGSA
jgi:5-methylcytosine-specific restriction endonuclease McrA